MVLQEKWNLTSTINALRLCRLNKSGLWGLGSGNSSMRTNYPRTNMWIEILGWYGVIAVLGAYALISFSLSANSLWYQGLNITGGLTTCR